MVTRAERAVEAARLRDEGLLQREIAAAMGVSRSYVAGLLSDPRGERDRVRKLRAGGTCVDCGAPTSYATGGPSERCGRCGLADFVKRAAVTHRANALPRRERIAALWRNGKALREIAAELGTTVTSVSVTMHRLRAEGCDLPYRRADKRVAA